MRTSLACCRRGAGRAILSHLIGVARSRGYERLSLETGTVAAFKPAQSLDESAGFTLCGPFGANVEDPHSLFLGLTL